MRWLPISLASLALAAVGSVLWAQMPPGSAPAPASSPYPAALTILAPQADVYSGPSTQAYYPTSRLRYGDRVVVLGESKQPGWVAILPPPGSFSWIDAKYVKLVQGVDKIGIVDAGDPKATVPIMPGSMVVNKEPNVEVGRVATGTQVLIVDRPQTVGGTTLYPIAPVGNEMRFLPLDVLRPGGTVVASNPWNSQVTPTAGYAPSTNQPNSSWPQNQASNPNDFMQLKQAADQMLAANNVDRARLLYLEALNQTNDPAWRNWLQNQLARLAPASNWNPNTPNGAPTYPVPNYSTTAASPYNPTSIAGARPMGQDANSRPGVDPTAPAGIGQKTWGPWGVLRSTTITSRDGGSVYVLENRDTRAPLMYVTTAPGQSLREYVGQTINVYGTLGYRNDPEIRMQYLVAEQIATPPAATR